MKKYIVILAIVAFSFCLANSSRAEIEITVDRFTGSTIVTTKPTAVVEKRPRFTLHAKYNGEAQKSNAQITIVLVSTSIVKHFRDCNTTHWLVDDKPFALPQPIYKDEGESPSIMEFLIIFPVPLSTLQQMVAAKKVEFRVCRDEFTLNEGEMADLRKFVGILESSSPPTPTNSKHSTDRPTE